MSSTSPQKRRHSAYVSSLLDQPMRQTRSMARISDAAYGNAQSSYSSQPKLSSPRKARASQATQLEEFDNDSPDISMAPCMESPKKGRFDDFEFELENSVAEVPTRRRRTAATRRTSTSPLADVGLPRSKTSVTLSSSTTSNMLLTSRKGNSAPREEEVNAGASPVKRAVPLSRPSRLLGSSTNRVSTLEAVSESADQKVPVSVGRAPTNTTESSSTSDTKPQTSNRLLFGTSDTSVKRNPFQDTGDISGLAALGEPRHSPVKRFQAKSEFVISSPDRPDRKPINLLELKPSPGKASRGIFRHSSALDDDDDDGWGDDSGSNTVDEIRLVKGPVQNSREATSSKEKKPPSSDSTTSSSLSTNISKSSIRRSTTTMDVKYTLSSETSDALASLEASLARLKAKTKSPPSTASTKNKEDSRDSTIKRELGTARPSTLTTSRTTFNLKSAARGDSSISARSSADQSADNSGFKRPSGRISALAKSRESSGDHRSALNTSMSSAKSIMSFGAPRLPGFNDTVSRPTRPLGLPTSRVLSSATSEAEQQAAQEEEEARVAEQKRQAELKAAKRKSMSSVLSRGMPPPLQKRDADTSSSSSTNGSKSVSQTLNPITATENAAESAEAKKAAKAARRRSLYGYTSAKRDGADGDRSIGNVSSGLINVTSGAASDADSSSAAPKKTRFLRGLTVLVDVRDLDGEDASAAWVEMLKNAGAKVMLRFGERKLTHIVYKSGKPSTLHSYRALDDPKPHVVGISWIVACMEQGKKADEKPYLVEVAKQAIFQTRKASMAPKHLPTSATSIRELPKEIEHAKKKLLAHAPAVPSPLRRKVSAATLLASRLAATTLNEAEDSSDTSSHADRMRDDGDDGDGDGEVKRLAAYRARVSSVLANQSAAVIA